MNGGRTAESVVGAGWAFTSAAAVRPSVNCCRCRLGGIESGPLQHTHRAHAKPLVVVTKTSYRTA